MTLQSTSPLIDYVEDGATLVHAIPFQFDTAAEIVCTRIPSGGVESAALVQGTDYTVTGGAGAPGTVTKTAGGTAGTTFRVRRVTQQTQSTSFSTATAFPAKSVEKAFDRDMKVAQETAVGLQLLAQRTVRGEAGEIIPALPEPANRISRFMQWAADGKSLLLLSVSDLAQLLAAPIQNLAAVIGKGDPGGNVMAIGLFIAAATLTIPAGTDTVRTSGYSSAGLGVADYAYDATVDAAYVAAHPRSSFVSFNGRGFKLVHDSEIPVEQFGVKADGVTDDTTALEAALTFLGTLGGGTAKVPGGTVVVSAYLTLPDYVNVRGAGRRRTRILATHAGGGGATASENLRNGSVFYNAQAINGTTACHISIEDLWVDCSNPANQGAGLYQMYGDGVYTRNVTFTGCKWGAVLEGSEDVKLDYTDLGSGVAGGAGLWIVNGPDLNPTAEGGFSNIISLRDCHINVPATSYGVVDDGGYCHTFDSCDFNAGIHGLRAAGVSSLEVINPYAESQAQEIFRLSNSTLSGRDVGGCLTSIRGGVLLATADHAAVNGVGNPGTLDLDGGISFGGGGGTNPVTGTANFYLLRRGVVSNASGAANLADGQAQNDYDIRVVNGTATATLAGTGFPASTERAGRFSAASGAGVGKRVPIQIDHGAGNGGEVLVESELRASAYADLVVRTRFSDNMGERLRINETGAHFPAGTAIYVNNVKVLGSQQAAIPNDASGAANQATVNAIIAALRAHGLIA